MKFGRLIELGKKYNQLYFWITLDGIPDTGLLRIVRLKMSFTVNSFGNS